MDYLDTIQNSINFIENSLKKDIKTKDVAEEVAFSLYHFHRIFLALVGTTIKDYIRRRRLTEAAKELLVSKRKIIQIAFDYQFETQESFTRAFKKMFGTTPGRYRRNKCHTDMFYQNKITLRDAKLLIGGFIMEPKIVTKDEVKVIGMRYYGANQNNEIPQMWSEFNQRIPEIKNIKPDGAAYGICTELDVPLEELTDEHEFEYIAGMEVTSLDEIPEGMVGKVIPAHKYAVFTVKGIQNIGPTYHYIYGDWAKETEHELDKAPDFEYYDERFDPNTPNDSELALYIPIK
jgi:AraC family transcriptional regulator